MIRRLDHRTRRTIRRLLTFSRKLVTAIKCSQAYIMGYLGSLELPFEPLNTWGHPCAERRHPNIWDQSIHQEIQSLEECKCARTLGPTEWWSSEGLGLVTLGVLRHLDSLGDRRLLVISWSLWEPQEGDLYTVWNLPFRRWIRSILSDHLLFVMQESSILCGCSNVD